MATPNVRDLLYAPGRLSFGPTDVTIAYPHGGTGLGLVKGVSVLLGPEYDPARDILASERGNQVADNVRGPAKAILSGFLHSWDSDIIQRLFPNTSVVSVAGGTGHRLAQEPGSVRAGQRMSDVAVDLVYTPDDLDHVPMLRMRNAMPFLGASPALQFAIDVEWAIPFTFVGIMNSSDLMYQFGQRHDIENTP